ncbi:hypothetical protein AY599_06460, partial [Leptolyngbya valderiana BDU 20041]
MGVRLEREISQNARVFIVTGMHRSGTSLVASFLEEMGVRLGDRLYPSDRFNPRGYYEDLDFLTFQRRILIASCHSQDGGWPDWGWTENETLDKSKFVAYREAARQLLETRKSLRLWGWKDPRTALMLEFWDELCPDANYIFVYRYPWDVSKSVSRTNPYIFNEASDFGLRVWDYYNRHILEFYKNHRDRCLLVSCNAIVCHPELFGRKVGEKFNSIDLSIDAAAISRRLSQKLFGSLDGDSPEVRQLPSRYWNRLTELEENADIPMGVYSVDSLFNSIDLSEEPLQNLEVTEIGWGESHKTQQQSEEVSQILQTRDSSEKPLFPSLERSRVSATDEVGWGKRRETQQPQGFSVGLRNEIPPTISHPEIPQFGETLQTPLFSTRENSQVSQTPILSVVIPCYNDGEYLEDAIRSVETYPEPIYEILIVNDGSTDSLTLAVLENLRQRGYRILTQPNRGLAVARNRGIEDARGRYILPLDADNRIRHEYIEKGIEILDRIPSVGVVYGDVLFFGTRNHIHRVPPFDLERLLQGNYIDACAVFRKQVWQEVGGYDTEIPANLGYEDWEFWLSVAETDWRFYKVSEVLFEYRMRSDSMVNACNIPENREKLFSYICQKHQSLYESRWLRVLVDKESATLQEKLRVDSLRQQLRQFQQRLREDLGLSKTPMSSQPLVSVCIPTYNGSRFLEEALASVEKQTYPNLEIIVADDGSTDETVELIKSFRDKLETPLRLFRNSRLGMVQNWNFCLEMATGKYIKFLFQDDVLSPQCIEAMVELAESDDDIGLVFAPRILLLSDDADAIPELMEVYQICCDVHRGWTKLESIQEGSQLLDDWQLLESPINKIGEPTAVLIRKSAVETVGNFDVELRQLVDVEMWWRILTRFKVGFLDTPLSYFRLHPRQQTFRHAIEGGFDEDALLKKVVESSRFSPRLRLEAVCRSLAFGKLANWGGWLCRLIPQVAASALRRLYSRGLREAVFREATVLEVGEFPETVNAAARGLLEMRYRRFEMSLVEIPSWLVGDYVTLATSQLPQWRELGEGKVYFRRLRRLTEMLLEAVMENPESAVWREAAMGFSLNVCFAPLYYIDVDFSELLAKRWRLLKFALSTHQHDLDWEFSPTPSGKIGVLWGMSRKPSSWEILHLVASRWVKAKSDVCCEEVSENSGFLESQPEFRVSKEDVSQWRVSEIPGFVETQRDSRVSRGDVSQWRVSEIPGFVESQFKRDVSKGELSQPGIGRVAENRDFLENPPQPDVSRGELSESEVSTTVENPRFLETQFKRDVSKGELSQSGVSENPGFVETQFKQDVSREESSESGVSENPGFVESQFKQDVSRGESSQSEVSTTGENLRFLENP